jgi:hypothetical protein
VTVALALTITLRVFVEREHERVRTAYFRIENSANMLIEKARNPAFGGVYFCLMLPSVQ